MFMHTIVPIDIVFDGLDKLNQIQYNVVNYKGVKMEVQHIKNDEYKIVRLISSDPNDYLNKMLNPGEVIKYHEREI